MADDDVGMRRLLAAVLELDGWDVQCASDGDEALALAAEYRPDAVLLDVMMPNADGLTALWRLRESDGGRECAVVMVSAVDDRETQRRAIDAGCDDYLVKPVSADELSARVLQLVRRIGIAGSLGQGL